MKKIIKLILIGIILFIFSGFISTASAAKYVPTPKYLVGTNHNHYGWANIVKGVTDQYLREVGTTNINLKELRKRIAKKIIQAGGWGCSGSRMNTKYCSVAWRAEHDYGNGRKLAYFKQEGKLIVGCGNLDLLVYRVAKPVSCNKLTYSSSKNPIIIGIDSTTKKVSCSATNAKTIKIDCGNGRTQTYLGNKNGTKKVTKTCIYDKVGKYTPKCIVNKKITSNSCKKELIVKERIGDCVNLEVNETTGAYTCSGDSNTVSYKLFSNNIQVSTNKSGVFNISKAGTYKLECIVNGEERPADPECTKTITKTQSKFDLALRKTILTEAPYNIGDTIEYKIEVFNQGGIDATNVEITDYIPENMELVVENGWSNMDSSRKTINKITSIPAGTSSFKNIKLKISSTAINGQTLKNFAEISNDNSNIDDCDSNADNINGNSDGEKESEKLQDDVIGNTCNDTNGDEDDHDIEKIIVGGKFDLALRKTIQSGTYNIGDIVPYTITVYNQGDIPAKNVEITDYIPTQMELVNSNEWSTMNSNRKTKHNLFNLAIGESKDLTINLKIKSGNKGDEIKNFAEISEDNAIDCDSEADNINGNGAGESTNLDDNNIGSKCSGKGIGDEDDHDIEVFQIGKETGEECKALVTGSLSFPINKNKEGLCEKTGETVDNFKSTTSGRTTTYTWNCKDTSGKIYTGGNCNASYTRGGHGGSSAKCYNIEKSGNKYTCTGNYKTRSIGIDCDGDGKFEQAVYSSNGSSFTKNGTAYSYKFTCSPQTDGEGNPIILKPKCGVSKNKILVNQSAGWKSSFQCKYIPNNTCGDGNVDKNNGEECDLGSKNGPNSACSSDCKLNSRKHSYSKNCGNSWSYYKLHENDICKNTTIPSGGEVAITTVSNFAIGHNQKVFNYDNITKTYSLNTENIVDSKALLIKNIGDTAMYFDDYLCLFDRGNKGKIEYNDADFNGSDLNIISGKNSYCENKPLGYLYPGQTKYLDASKLINNVEEMKGNTSHFDTTPGNKKIRTSHLVLTVKNGGATYDWSPILAGQMYITVAKSSVSNQGGGTTYFAHKSEISNIGNIADIVKKHNKGINANVNTKQNNFVSTVLGDAENLSDVDTINTSNNNDNYGKSDTFSDINNVTINNYKGLSNVFSIKGDINSSSIINKGGDISKTFIINGNLTIDNNIKSNKNIAFIVKGGNITIKDNVTQIDGTYINIGGIIKGDDNTSSEILKINGSMYGKAEELYKNRTHISMDQNGNINVGTVISYGSDILKKPAPLVGQFIGEYLNSEKIAQ